MRLLITIFVHREVAPIERQNGIRTRTNPVMLPCGIRTRDTNQQKRSPGVTTHRTDLPGYGPAILPLSTAAAFPCSVAGLRRFTAHYQPRGPRLRANPAVDHRLGSDRPWLHMTSQVGGAKHRIHIGLSAHSGHRRALPRPTNQSLDGGWRLATGVRMHNRPLCPPGIDASKSVENPGFDPGASSLLTTHSTD